MTATRVAQGEIGGIPEHEPHGPSRNAHLRLLRHRVAASLTARQPYRLHTVSTSGLALLPKHCLDVRHIILLAGGSKLAPAEQVADAREAVAAGRQLGLTGCDQGRYNS